MTDRRGPSEAIDALLEVSVVGSWSAAGPWIRSRLFDWTESPPSSMAGRVVVVTGGTSGIGRATALGCARAGAQVGVVGRDPERAARAARELTDEAGGEPVWSVAADMSSLADVASLVRSIAARTTHLDALVHAAGALEHERRSSAEGTELTAAVHLVGPHLLTTRLAPLLGAAGTSVVVWVSSGGMYTQTLDVARLAEPGPYRGAAVYARTKRAQVTLARLWGQQLAGTGGVSFSMHPGWVDTTALRRGLPTFATLAGPLLRDPAWGADTVLWLVGGGPEPGARSGFWLDRRPRALSRWPGRPDPPGEDRRLWDWCEERAGLADPAAGGPP